MPHDENTNKSFKAKELKYSSKAAKKALKALPDKIQIQFLQNLEMIRYGLTPELKIEHLESIGSGVIELKINGSPAYRCIYYNKLPGKVVVLHAAKKTTNGTDSKILKLAEKRLKSLLKSLKKG